MEVHYCCIYVQFYENYPINIDKHVSGTGHVSMSGHLHKIYYY